MHRAAKRSGFFVVLCLLFAACDPDEGGPSRDTGRPPVGDTVDGLDTIRIPDLHEPGNDVNPDQGDLPAPPPDLDPDPDAKPPDADVRPTDSDVPPDEDCPGGAGCPCVDDDDCDESICIETAHGYECAVPCLFQVQCPAGRYCRDVTREGADLLRVCVDPLSRLCQPCVSHDDCEPLDGGFEGDHVCLHHGPVGSFCTAPCDDLQCPEGYVCEELLEHPGAVAQCVPLEPGQCPCLDVFVEREAVTYCSVDNEYGSCTAPRRCDEPCGARTPAPEVCNGIDDDCNGLTDDGTEDECFPLYCDSAAGACKTACENLADCQPGFNFCVNGVCVSDGGNPCVEDTECASGFCVDDVCCESRCGGVCEWCAQPDALGHCRPTPRGLDPDAECPAEPVESCGRVGGCSGHGGCEIFPLGTTCVPSYCDDEVTQVYGECDGVGGCVVREVDCAPLMCNAEIGGCKLTCTIADDCPLGYTCDDGECRKDLGTPCAMDEECASDFCVDGVCCNDLCDGVCEWCVAPGQEGLCLDVPAGEDPRDDCETESVGSCGLSGVCGGDGTCALYSAGTQCVANSCRSNVLEISATCDGEGACIEHENYCAPFACLTATGRCATTCEGNVGCQPGYACRDGECLKGLGNLCADASECASGFCTSGYCCTSDCAGVCESCTQPGKIGVCSPFSRGSDPRGECPAEHPESCGRAGGCSGESSCLMYGSGTRCAEGMCIDELTSLPVGVCDGTGTCAQEPVSCAPFLCNLTTGACRITCTSEADCEPGADCQDSVCGRAVGEPCSRNGECSTRFCAQGVCCQGPCGGLCERCDLAGSVGRCEAVPAGQDPSNDCPPTDPETCGRTGFCSGNRTCALYPAGEVCADPQCVDGWSHGAAYCDGGGRCVASAFQNCAPYECDDATGTCFTGCSSSAQCVENYTCSIFGDCRGVLGQPCGSDSQCASGFCADGVCCESRCGGICEACNLEGRKGFCDPVPEGAPAAAAECPSDPVSSCGRTGNCSGARSCQLYPYGTVCIGGQCALGSLANLPHICDGEGECFAQGSADCTPYACNASDVSCYTACSTGSHCASGYGCDLSTGVCRRSTGLECLHDIECLSGACCDGICRDLTVDINNCGACGLVCVNSHGTTSCFGSECRPVCSIGHDNCDGDSSSGCEQSLATLTDCGACDNPCDRPNAVVSCSTQSCTTVGCEHGWGDCDDNRPNGCETSLSVYSNACGSPTGLGTLCGNNRCGRYCLTTPSWTTHTTVSGRGSRWFQYRVADRCSNCGGRDRYVQTRVSLSVPSSTNYDIFAYRSCGAEIWRSSTNGMGANESFTASVDNQLNVDNSFDIWIEVRYVEGAGCGNWTLTVEGRDC